MCRILILADIRPMGYKLSWHEFSWSHELKISQNNFENKVQFLGPYNLYFSQYIRAIFKNKIPITN